MCAYQTTIRRSQSNLVLMILQVALIIFFVVVAIQGIRGPQPTDPFNKAAAEISEALGLNNKTEREWDTVSLLHIALLLPALLFVLSLLGVGNKKIHYLAVITAFLLWGGHIAVVHFMEGITVTEKATRFAPDFLTWLYHFSGDLVILISSAVLSGRST